MCSEQKGHLNSPSSKVASRHRNVTEGDVSLIISFPILFLPVDRTTMRDCGLPSSTGICISHRDTCMAGNALLFDWEILTLSASGSAETRTSTAFCDGVPL